jgi:AraC-like DNA-binding protein/tetratricopeptide (TPR) repeat protein
MTAPLSKDQEFISRLADIILENLGNENFGVKELAVESGMSLYSLSRKLHSINRKTVNQFIREVRLHKALEMLQNDEYTASEVAFKTGFGSASYFNKCFHEFFGYPPGKVKIGSANNWEQNILNQVIEENKLNKTILKSYILSFPGILLLVLLLLTLGFLIYSNIIKSEAGDDLVSSDGKISIAVMPFRNISNDSTMNIWQDGIQEYLIASLSNNKELKVKRREIINALIQTGGLTKYASISPDFAGKISQKLDANLFIYGSIMQTGSRIKLGAQLIDSKTNEILRSFEINGSFSGEISFDLMDSLKKELTDYLIVSKLIKENPIYGTLQLSMTSSEAFRYYLYGDQALEKLDNTAAIEWYLKALEIDSTFFEPMIRLSSVYGNLGMLEKDLQWVLKYYKMKDRWTDQQKIAANWAYALSFEPPMEGIKYLKMGQKIDDDDPSIPYLLGLSYNLIKQYDKAIPELENHLKISKKWSNDFLKNNWAYWMLGEAYNKTGQYRKERKLYREARHYIPETWLTTREALLAFSEKDTNRANRYTAKYLAEKKKMSSTAAEIEEGLGDIYFQAGLMEKAEGYYRRALSLDPGNMRRIVTLANFLVESKRNLEDVQGLMDKAMESAQDSVVYYNYCDTKGMALYKQGKYKEALAILQNTWDKAPFKLYTYRSHLEEAKKAAAEQK